MWRFATGCVMHAAEPPEAAEAAASYGPRQQLRHRIRRVMSLADRASKVRRVTASHAFIVYRCKMAAIGLAQSDTIWVRPRGRQLWRV